ncbi:MAG: hypothetical protein AMXMBFR33_39560 [Candidatus Xenobia bacterium]
MRRSDVLFLLALIALAGWWTSDSGAPPPPTPRSPITLTLSAICDKNVPAGQVLVVRLTNSGPPVRIPASLCRQVDWSSMLAFRVQAGKQSFELTRSWCDIESVHDHGPLTLTSGQVLEARVGLLELLESEPGRATVLAARKLEIQARLVPGRETGPFAEPPALIFDESLVSNILTLSF